MRLSGKSGGFDFFIALSPPDMYNANQELRRTTKAWIPKTGTLELPGRCLPSVTAKTLRPRRAWRLRDLFSGAAGGVRALRSATKGLCPLDSHHLCKGGPNFYQRFAPVSRTLTLRKRKTPRLPQETGRVTRSALPLFLPSPHGKRPLTARSHGPTE